MKFLLWIKTNLLQKLKKFKNCLELLNMKKKINPQVLQKVLLKKEMLMKYLEDEKIDTLITFGAGNIDRFIPQITEMLSSQIQLKPAK